MPKLFIVYGTQTGNTERMAEAVAEGARSVSGVEVILKSVNEVRAEELSGADAIVLGSPTHRKDVIYEMSIFLNELRKVKLTGKVGAAFGSYGWSGEGVEVLNQAMKSYGMTVVEPGMLVKRSPQEKDIEECRNFGKAIAEKLMKT
jgi:flavodoxin short chain